MAGGFIHGPLGADCLHLCVDMQRLFGPGSAWAAPWLETVTMEEALGAWS